MMLVGRIVIQTEMNDEGHLFLKVTSEDPAGDELSLLESLGMIEMAKDSLLHGPDGLDEPDE